MTEARSSRLTIEVHLHAGEQERSMAEDVRRGLTAPRKYLSPKYFYDALGSEIFEQITELPEYYQTRTEQGILDTIASGLAERYGTEEVVELGSGSAKKTTTILDALSRSGTLRRYVPFDVSEPMLRLSAAQLLERYPSIEVHGVIGDFTRHLTELPGSEGKRMVVFLGSTIGNLHDAERLEFLRSVKRTLQSGDIFLLGVDLVKDTHTLEAAYNDAQGVTAAFNKNILRVMNRSLNADFDVAAFEHYAFFNEPRSRIEMHLVPSETQTVHVRAIDLEVSITPPETIWTEISCKFTRNSIDGALGEAGLALIEWHTDPLARFAVLVAAPAS